MSVSTAFVKWIFAKIFEGLHEFHLDFKRDLRRQPGITIFLWFIVSLITSIVALLALCGIDYVLGTQTPVQVWFGYMWLCVAYLIYTGFNVMYNTFKAERAELFETIKNGK